MALSHSVETLTLDNGSAGLVVSIPGIRTVYMTFAFRAGAQYVPESNCQVPHIIEHMAFTHPGEFESQEAFSREFTRFSASEDAMTDETNIVYEATCSLSEFSRILDLMKQVIAEPVFTEDNFEVEKSTILEELTANLNNDSRIFWQMANRMSGGGGRKDQEKIDSLATTTLDDVKRFYEQSHVSDNMRFVIAGDLNPAEVAKHIALWPLSRGTRPDVRQDNFVTLTKPVLLERPEYGTLDFSVSLLEPGLLSYEEDAAWTFVHHLLFRTYHSRVFGHLRSKGLCYDISASHSNMIQNYRELEIFGSATNEHIEATLRYTIDQLISLANGELTDGEVEEVRDYIRGSEERRLETGGEVAGFYESQYLLLEDYVKEDYFVKILNSLTKEQIVEYVRHWLTKRQSRFGLIGDIDYDQANRLQAMVNGINKGVH